MVGLGALTVRNHGTLNLNLTISVMMMVLTVAVLMGSKNARLVDLCYVACAAQGAKWSSVKYASLPYAIIAPTSPRDSDSAPVQDA